MDPWDVFSELCCQVVEEQNVYLEVTIYNGSINMALWPYNEEDFRRQEKRKSSTYCKKVDPLGNFMSSRSAFRICEK